MTHQQFADAVGVSRGAVQQWVDAYHSRKFSILPGDSLKCRFEESVTYDASGNELARTLAVIEVLEIISPPVQQKLI